MSRCSRSRRPSKGSRSSPALGGVKRSAIALTVKSRRRRSSSIDAGRTVGSAPGRSYVSARACARSTRAAASSTEAVPNASCAVSAPLPRLRQLPRQPDGVALDRNVQVDVRPSQQQVAHASADEVELVRRGVSRSLGQRRTTSRSASVKRPSRSASRPSPTIPPPSLRAVRKRPIIARELDNLSQESYHAAKARPHDETPERCRTAVATLRVAER